MMLLFSVNKRKMLVPASKLPEIPLYDGTDTPSLHSFQKKCSMICKIKLFTITVVSHLDSHNVQVKSKLAKELSPGLYLERERKLLLFYYLFLFNSAVVVLSGYG